MTGKVMAEASATVSAAADKLADTIKPAYQGLERAMQGLDDARDVSSRSH
jgi:hypothetical protein